MAITAIEAPNKWMPVYNPIIYRYSSDLSTQNNFEIKLSIEVRSIDETTGLWSAFREIAELSQPIGPDGTARFDIHKYLANELSYSTYFDTPNKVSCTLKNGTTCLQYKVTPSEVYTSDLLWQFNRITKYTDAFGVVRPNFNWVAPLTDDHLFNSYGGYVVKIVLDDGTNPTGELFHNQLFTITDSSNDANLYTSNGAWLVAAETEYIEAGTAQLISEVTITDVGATSSVVTAWNGVKKFDEWVEWNEPIGASGTPADPNYIYNEVFQDTYFSRQFATDYSTKKMITSIPTTGFECQLHDYIWINGHYPQYSTGFSEWAYLVVKTDNGTYSFNMLQDVLDPEFGMNIVTQGIGPANLTGVTPTTVNLGALPIIDADTTFIEFYHSTNVYTVAKSEVYRIDIVDPCTRYDKYSILFLDTWGSIIPINLYLVRRNGVQIKRTDFTQNYGKYYTDKNGNQKYTYDNWDRGITNIDTTYSEATKMTTDWLDETHNSLVQEMLLSPVTWLKDEDGTIRAINITNSSFERKTILNDQLVNYNIEFVFSNQNRTNI